MTFSREALFEAAEASPARVAVHDRAGWLALFAREAEVEDPVGGPVHRRDLGPRGDPSDKDPVGLFWDTFIGPNEIRFDVHMDAVDTRASAVARRVTIHIHLQGGLVIAVPAYLLYDFVDENGRPRLRRLAAHWSMARSPLVGRPSPGAALRSGAGQTARLLRNQGLLTTAAYSVGLARGLAARPSRLLARFTEAVNRGDLDSLSTLCQVQAPSPGHPPQPGGSLAGLAAALRGPGPFEALDPIATASSVAFHFRSGPADTDPRGIAFLERDASLGRSRRRLRAFFKTG